MSTVILKKITVPQIGGGRAFFIIWEYSWYQEALPGKSVYLVSTAVEALFALFSFVAPSFQSFLHSTTRRVGMIQESQ